MADLNRRKDVFKEVVFPCRSFLQLKELTSLMGNLWIGWVIHFW